MMLQVNTFWNFSTKRISSILKFMKFGLVNQMFTYGSEHYLFTRLCYDSARYARKNVASAFPT